MSPNELAAPANDLFWQAFRYVADELTPEEALAFETRLANEQAAREAVAQAVELSHAVKAAVPEPQPVDTTHVVLASATHDRWMQPIGWLAAGVAACLALVMTWQTFGPVKQQDRSKLAPLALAWAETQADSDEPADDEDADADSLSETIDLLAVAEMSDEDLEALAPSWMRAAVSLNDGTGKN